eukprot:COSAG01_NODE_710_length_14110_cov_94.506745_14_plen_30_part_00
MEDVIRWFGGQRSAIPVLAAVGAGGTEEA